MLKNIIITINPFLAWCNMIQGPSTETSTASKTEIQHAGGYSRRSQDDTAGRKRASVEQEAPAQNMRPYPTNKELRARSRATIEHTDETESSRQTRTKSYTPLSPTTPWATRQEVCAPLHVGVPENEMWAPPQAGAASPISQGAEESRGTRRPRLYDTTHDSSRQLSAPPPSVTRSMSSHMIVRDNQSVEMEQLKKQLASYKKENEKLAGERKDAEEIIRDMTAVLHTTRAEARRLHDELSKKKSENDKLRQEVEHLKGSINMSRSLEAKLQETESALASTRNSLDTATNQLKAMSEQKTQLHTLLNDRTFELKGAQSFLTTADAFSGADVISVLQKLNAEVLQSAAYMAESMVDTFSFESGGVRNENAYAVVTGLFGQSLAHYLATKKHKYDPLLIQITFQSCFVQFLEFVICSWTLPGDDSVNRMLASTYERMRCGEAQAISGRWRALTSAYAHNHEESQLIASVTPYLTGHFSNIMLAAGCSVEPEILRASVEKKLSDRIILLFKLALQLNKIMMEEITSADLRTVTVPFETTYSAEQMEDAYVDGDPAAGGVRVLCTTDLGLRRITRLATSGDKQWDDKLLLKPKVALKTVVDSMDG
ncbi:uncharacterized protein BJ212DRAFT_528756 [Suillus subaureus]|uniref:Uncharacterized protein n=1 Tax=Suillus subaureus TaxID=48587 RepID=A0A9P7EKF5_9AGAM|nr:uncharacterized protein BJ212DRAFT_528756 [Suillus subaureus]KAG1824475.1 hypothetical protein BJ212DRAFT_528756 [Suillus subaureus]